MKPLPSTQNHLEVEEYDIILSPQNNPPLSDREYSTGTKQFHSHHSRMMMNSNLHSSVHTILTALSPQPSQKSVTSSQTEPRARSQSFERLKKSSNRQNQHFKLSAPTLQLKGENDVEENEGNDGILYHLEESARDNTSSCRSQSYGGADINSYQTFQKENTNTLFPDSKTHGFSTILRIQKKSAEFGNGVGSNEDVLSVNLRTTSKYKKTQYLKKSKNGGGTVNNGEGSLFQAEGSVMQDSQMIGSRSFRDDLSEFQNTIVATQKNGLTFIWKKRSLAIIQKVARFMNIILVFSRTKKFQQLRRDDFKIIGDIACNYKYFLYNDFLINDKPSPYQKLMYGMSSKIKRNVGSLKNLALISVLKPYSMINVIWDIVMLIITAINIFLIPLICFFDEFDGSEFAIKVVKFSIFVYFADIFVILNTAFFERGVMQENRRQIILRYFKLHGFWDFIALVPYIVGSTQFSKYFYLLLLFKSIKHLVEVFQPSEKINMIIRIANVFLLIFIIAHLTSSGFVFVAMQQHKNDDLNDNSKVSTWISNNNLLDQDWSVLYINGLYWAIISMITIGYGDITPITPEEKAYTIFTSMLSCAVFAYCINTISQIITDLKQKQKKLKIRITNLNKFLQSRGLEMHLQMKVRKFIEHIQYSEESEGSALKDLELIPESIKEEVQIDIYGRILRNIKLFKVNFSYEAINNLAVRVTECSFGPGEIIYKKGDSSSKIFVVLSGRISLSIMIQNNSGQNNTERNVGYVEQGQVFGVEDFFCNSPHKLEAKALQLTQLIEISEADLCTAFGLSSQFDLEKYQMLRDKAIFSKSTRGLGVQCFYCSSFDHSYTECPNVTLPRNKPLCLARYNYSQSQLNRKPFQRQPNRIKINSVSQYNFFSRSVAYYLNFKQFQENLVQSDGFTDETENVRPRNRSSFSQFLTSQKNINRLKLNTSTYHDGQQTSIKLGAQTPSLIQLDGIEQIPLTPYSDPNVDDRSPNNNNNIIAQMQQKSFLKFIRQKSREHSISRVQKRNLTNIVEERSAFDATNSSSQNSQLFQSNLNPINAYNQPIQPQNQRFMRSNSNIRNLTWNGGNPVNGMNIQANQQQQQQLTFTQQQQTLLQQMNIPVIPSQFGSNLNQNFTGMLSKLESNLDSEYQQSQQQPSIILQQNQHQQIHISPRMQAYQPQFSGLGLGGSSFSIANEVLTRGSQSYLNQVDRRNSNTNQTTPRNVIGSFNQTSNLQVVPPNHRDPIQVGTNTLQLINSTLNGNISQQVIHQPTYNSNQHSNSELNGLRNNLNGGNEAGIELQSVRNIKASNNWDHDQMKNFDCSKIFQQYFPHNNIDRVLERANGPFFLVQKKQERNKKRQSLRKQMQYMKKRSIIDSTILNPSKQVMGSHKLSLNNIMDINTINLSHKEHKDLKVKVFSETQQEVQSILVKDNNNNNNNYNNHLGGDKVSQRGHKSSYQDSTGSNGI